MSKNKIVSIILLLILAVMSLSACDAGQIKIEDYEWKMRTVTVSVIQV